MTSRAYPPPDSRSRGPLLVLVGALALLAALLPLAWMLDGKVDGDRPLDLDRQQMAFAQHLNLLAGGEPVTGRVGPGTSKTVGERRFSASPGVTVEVRAEGEGYCVRAIGDDGHETSWLCHDVKHPPAQPTGDPLAEA